MIIKVNRGPQFREGKVVLPFFLLFIFILFTLAALFVEGPLFGLVFIPFDLLLIFIVLDIRGVDIDMEKKIVKSYRMMMFYKIGNWVSMKNFESIRMDYKSYFIKHIAFYSVLTGASSSPVFIEKNDNFTVYLVNKKIGGSIVLLEGPDYFDLKSQGIKLSEKLGIPFKMGVQRKPIHPPNRPQRRR